MEPVKITTTDKHLKNLFWFCLSCELFIVLSDIFLNHFKLLPWRPLRRMVNITREDSIGTWFSSFQMLAIGLVLLLFVWALRKVGEEPKWKVRGWALISGFFLFMGIDDAVKFHERVGSSFKQVVNSGERIGPTFTWHLVLGPFFVAMGLFICFFMWKELGRSRAFRFIFTGLSMYGIAVGMDFVEGLRPGPFPAIAELLSVTNHDVRHMSKVVEEFLEMLGTTYFLLGFVSHFLARFPNWELRRQ